MKYVLPKPDLRYFDEGLNSKIESHSHAQLRIEVAKARADEREACAYRAGIALLGADRGLANRVDKAIRNEGNT